MKASAFKLALVVFLIGGLFFYPKLWVASSPEKPPSFGNIQTFLTAYERWKVKARQHDGDRKLILSLSPVRGLSSQFSNARGTMTLDLFDGSLLVEAYGLPEIEAFDVWLIDNLPGPKHSVRPDPGDALIKVGSLKWQGDTAKLETRLNREDLANFKLDVVAVTPVGKLPHDDFRLFGSPGLFQRLHYSENRGQVVRLGNDKSDHNINDSTLAQVISAPFRALIPGPAHANSEGQVNIQALIAQGENLFFNDNFKGNGRTCGTCHPAENNFTLDPAFIATLPVTDPLFAAEFVDALNSEKNGGLIFEIPSLMRSKALIVENVDGMDDLKTKFVMRGIPHTLALGVALEPAPNFGQGPIDGSHASRVQRTGWGGDGAPLDGSLRNFMIGAIIQHYPLTLNRIAGVDFILPTDDQLDALEAFQLSLGRATEFGPLPLDFKEHLADVAAGQRIFLNLGTDPAVGAGKCNVCHENAGSNLTIAGVGSFNFNFNTGVEPALQNKIGSDPRRPPDGGFGTDPTGGFTNVPNSDKSFGNGTFNTPVLVEAADTPPFFHNNFANTIEEAVNFYTSQEFQNSPAGAVLNQLTGGGINLLDFEVEQVGAFLRVINALENIRSVIASSNTAKEANTLVAAKKHLKTALADCQDAIDVVNRRDAGLTVLDKIAVDHLRAAKSLLARANLLSAKTPRDALINSALQRFNAARERLVN